MPLMDIKEKYPLVFTSKNLTKEFNMMQDIEVSNLILNFKNCAEKIIFEGSKKQKGKDLGEVMTQLLQKHVSALELKRTFFSYCDAVDKFEIGHKLLCAFLLLPILLREVAKDLYKIIMPVSIIENVSADTFAPVIIFIGNPVDTTELYSCGENNIKNAVSAIAVLFCVYYV